MKAMRKLVWMLLAVSMVGFTSCDSDDDDWIDDGGQGSGGSDEGGVVTPSGSGTYADPWNVAAAKENQGTDYKFVKGFIVGNIPGGDLEDAQFAPPFSGTDVDDNPITEGTNILLAASADEKNVANCIPVKLTYGDVRTGLNLITEGNAEKNLGKEVILQCKLDKGFGTQCITATYYAELNGETFGSIVETGGFDVPEISLADVLDMFTGTAVTITEDKKFVAVVISDKDGGNSTSLKNVIVASPDNSCGITLRCTTDASFAAGDKIEVKVKGQSLERYNNNGALQLNNIPFVMIQKVGTATVTPKQITVADLVANINQYESTLVTVSGEIVAAREDGKYGDSTKKSHTTNTIKDGDATIESFVSKYSAFCGETIPTGEREITGIAGINNNKPQLNIRNASEVK